MWKKILGAIIIIILIISVVLLTVGSSILPSAGYRVEVKGTAYYNIATGWGVTYSSYTVVEDNWIPDLPFTFLNDKVDVEVYLSGPGNYHGSTRLPGHNPVLWEHNFDVPIRWVQHGTYSGRIDLYHVDMDDLTGFIQISRIKVASTSFEGLTV